MIKRSGIVAFVLESIVLIISLMLSVDWQFALTIMIWCLMLVYVVQDYNNRIVLGAFIGTFFIFLLGAYVCYQYLHYDNDVVLFNSEIMKHIYFTLNLALISVWIGFAFAEKKSKNRKKNEANEQMTSYSNIVKRLSKWGYFLCYLPYIAVLLEKVVYVGGSGYTGVYLGYNSSFPYIIRLLANMAPMMLFIFLSTLPTKKECKIPLLLYILYLGVSLGSGQRSDFVIGILVIGIYYFFRNTLSNNGEKWITKKEILLVVILGPILLLFLNFYGNIRFGENQSSENAILDIFTSQGVSVSVIGYERVYANSIPDSKLYSIGGIIDFLKYNPVSSSLFHFVEYTGQNAERALNGNSMAHIISYFVLPFNYNLGRGLGSCYLAELFHDFGYIGVILGNILYGIVIKSCSNFNKYKIWGRYICFVMISAILLAPRSTTDGFISELFGMEVWGTALIVWILSNYIYKRRI
nr:O-antigen polysaccharide polymerase Wzy family protein [uncultured Sellimonas sp.]